MDAESDSDVIGFFHKNVSFGVSVFLRGDQQFSKTESQSLSGSCASRCLLGRSTA